MNQKSSLPKIFQFVSHALTGKQISESIEENVSLKVIAKNCGTSVRMIEITCAKLLAEKQRKFVSRDPGKVKPVLRLMGEIPNPEGRVDGTQMGADLGAHSLCPDWPSARAYAAPRTEGV